MAQASYAMWLLIITVGVYTDQVALTPDMLAWVVFILFLSQAAFFIAIRTGWNLRFRDPAMTLEQIAVALIWALVLVAVADKIRGQMLSVYMVTLLFGIFALDSQRYIWLSFFAFVGFLFLTLWEVFWEPGPVNWDARLISLMVLAGVVIWTSLFGMYVSNLRHRLGRRNDDLEEALARIRVLAERDDLTGLYNRRFIMNALRAQRARAEREGEPFAIAIIDFDFFKEINDRHGHVAGDRVLREFADAARSQLRGMDLFSAVPAEQLPFGRYGGEEFLILMPATDIEGAIRCAERLRQFQRQSRGGEADVPVPTISAGVAEYRPGEDVDALLRRADDALYTAKESGRDRVCVASA